MRLPEVPGDYKLRYVTRQSKRILARRPITLEAVQASLTAADTAQIGEILEISWTGPGNDYDQIALFALDAGGAGDDAQPIQVQRIASRNNPVPMRLPEVAGDYELRYLTARDGVQLASRTLHIASSDVALDAADRATANTLIEVRWTGPGNNYDTIGVYPTGSPDDARALSQNAILGSKNPVDLKLPDTNGEFELRYATAHSKQVLARRPIRIEPSGRLAVVYERQRETGNGSSNGTGAVELILDASGSMLQKIDGTRRIEMARGVLDDLVRNQLSDDTPFALRVFGHQQANACRTDLEIPLGPLDRSAAAAKIAGVNAMNLAKTPIADSLAQIPADLARATGPKTIVLITDGEETCNGDPAAVIKQLRAEGLDIQVSIVGFAIDDPELRSTFQNWAEMGGGSYFDAGSADELQRSLRTVISGPFRVLDASGKMVGGGVIGGAPIVLPAGTYRVETGGSNPLVIEAIEVLPGELSKAAF